MTSHMALTDHPTLDALLEAVQGHRGRYRASESILKGRGLATGHVVVEVQSEGDTHKVDILVATMPDAQILSGLAERCRRVELDARRRLSRALLAEL